MEELIREWLRFAKQDFDVAKHLYETFYPRPLETICYHCQQSAEKGIKAVTMTFGAPGGVPKSHDLVFLLNQIRNLTDVEEIYPQASALTPYGVTARYPGEMDMEDRNAQQALAYAEIILDWCRVRIDENQIP